MIFHFVRRLRMSLMKSKSMKYVLSEKWSDLPKASQLVASKRDLNSDLSDSRAQVRLSIYQHFRHFKLAFMLFISGHPSFSSVQFSSLAQSCPTLCDPMNRSMPGLPVYHQLPEFTQTHVHRVSDAIQPSHPVVPFSSCPQSLPASESFPMSQFFA